MTYRLCLLMETTDDICKIFHSYNFEADSDFQSGIQTIFQQCEKTTEKLLQAQLFYFSKKYGKITDVDYRGWLKDNNLENQIGVNKDQNPIEESKIHIEKEQSKASTEKSPRSNVCEAGDMGTDGTNALNNLETVDSCQQLISQIVLSEKDDEIKTVLSEKETDEMPIASFGQVVEMISKGLPLPGVTELDIKPLDIEPTVTRMERRLKPWEQG
ncbi:uncharacterized protein LOC133200501 [Saccostrea echinata]|uniref:uncharacterized protein LOC133200501 n=1 Tax=Saccostrea echinata TaxID=191078 RepID=UPI002A802D9F|nr:uncharacterized protein LOC133200501 [Saccostrea echinata]